MENFYSQPNDMYGGNHENSFDKKDGMTKGGPVSKDSSKGNSGDTKVRYSHYNFSERNTPMRVQKFPMGKDREPVTKYPKKSNRFSEVLSQKK